MDTTPMGPAAQSRPRGVPDIPQNFIFDLSLDYHPALCALRALVKAGEEGLRNLTRLSRSSTYALRNGRVLNDLVCRR